MEIANFVMLCVAVTATITTLILTIILRVRKRRDVAALENLQKEIAELKENGAKTESLVREELICSREEFSKNSKDDRMELLASVKAFEDSLLRRMTENSTMEKNQLELFSNKLTELIGQRFQQSDQKQNDLMKNTESRLDGIRADLDTKLKSIQENNTEQLEKMRLTVDEKLHQTLETRLTESFKMVSERLELVQKGLGEMQSLATGVGDLKKVLSNVKSKGTLGEYQLENILEQILTPSQYEKNVATRPSSNERVEFAVKLPAKDDLDGIIYLPIDAKLPTEDYYDLLDAYEGADAVKIADSKKALEQKIKKFAKDIRDKYIEAPYTTDFGIMFLPFEGLYAEVLRINGLFETLQREYKIVITGPTTVAAFLNSLQMGFRTLAIEKRSSEVWNLLSAVKTEFSTFGDILDKTQKKLHEASDVISKAGVRTRAIERKLKDVQELPSEDAVKFFPEPSELEDELADCDDEPEG